jgi:dTDP-4-amino-4,6-dideoxygalactose transaminase
MGYQIPLFNLNFDEAENKAVVDVLNSKWISSGPKTMELEKKFADMLGAKYAVAVSNCTAALHLAVMAAGVGPGDEVIVPSLTFVATVNCVKYAGGTPVFCDIVAKDNLCIDPEQIEKLITPKTKAVIVMHYGGFACDLDRILDVCNKHNIALIEDACHGPMSEYKGKKLGTFGLAGCFSFFSNKNISTGEGGILVTNSEEVYEKVKLLRSHGMTTMSYERSTGHSTSYDVISLGYNYRFNDILAGIGLVQLDKLMPDITKRQHVREKYISLLEDDDRLIIPFKDYNALSSLYICPMVLRDGGAEYRDALRQYLADYGIQTSMHYPPSHRFSIYKDLPADLTVTEFVADHEFTIPMYGALTDDEIEYICKTIKDGLNNL